MNVYKWRHEHEALLILIWSNSRLFTSSKDGKDLTTFEYKSLFYYQHMQDVCLIELLKFHIWNNAKD